MDSFENRKDLVVEIFRATGLKVDVDDPIVLAALYQAHIIRDASKSTVEGIAVQTAKLEDASQQIRAHLQELISQSGALATAKMKEAREKEESELRRTACAAIEASIEAAVGKGVSRLNDALKILEISAARSEQKVARAAEASRPAWTALLLGVTVLSAVLGGIGGFLVSRFL